MADKADLRNMVLSFRVSELQLLLGLTSQSRCGRKTELMQRALALIERGVSVPVQLKIRELYQRFTPRPGGGGAGYSPPPSQQQQRHMSSAAAAAALHSKAMGLGGAQQQHATLGANMGHGGGGVGVGGRGTNGVHRGSLSDLLTQQQQRSQIPAHPDVKYKHLPFYDLLGEILRPTSLVPRSAARQQEARVSFCLNDQQVRDIAMSRPAAQDPAHGADRLADFTVQIQLRFCLLDTSCRQPDIFPSNICVKVNGMMAPLPNPIPTNKPGVEPKRPSRPVDITRICRLSATVANTMTITWNADETKNHCVAVYLVRKLDSAILLQRLRRSGVQKAETTKNMVREKLSLDMDADLATTSMRVSLLCPLGKMRMSLPCRASSCNHLQCFDGPTFLLMNEKKPTWMCPVCDRPADFNRLVIDGLFTEIIRDSVDSTEVELSKDGRWHVTKTDDSDDESNCGSPKPPTHPPDSAVDVVDRPECTPTTGGVGGGGDCIDLTEDDDEGIEPGTNASSSRSTATPSCYTPPSAGAGSGPSNPLAAASAASSPPRSSGSPAVYDLSPLHIPRPTPSPASSVPRGGPGISPALAPPLLDAILPAVVVGGSTPPLLAPNAPMPPRAHQSYAPFTLSKLNASSHHPAFAHSHNSSSAAYFGAAAMGAAAAFDGLMQPDMMDFLSMMSGMAEYAVSPQFSLPSNAFDYLYQGTGGAGSGRGEQHKKGGLEGEAERNGGRGSPTMSS